MHSPFLQLLRNVFFFLLSKQSSKRSPYGACGVLEEIYFLVVNWIPGGNGVHTLPLAPFGNVIRGLNGLIQTCAAATAQYWTTALWDMQCTLVIEGVIVFQSPTWFFYSHHHIPSFLFVVSMSSINRRKDVCALHYCCILVTRYRRQESLSIDYGY